MGTRSRHELETGDLNDCVESQQIRALTTPQGQINEYSYHGYEAETPRSRYPSRVPYHDQINPRTSIGTPVIELLSAMDYLSFSELTGGSYTWSKSPIIGPQQISHINSATRHEDSYSTDYQGGEIYSSNMKNRGDAGYPSPQEELLGFRQDEPSLSSPANSINCLDVFRTSRYLLEKPDDIRKLDEENSQDETPGKLPATPTLDLSSKPYGEGEANISDAPPSLPTFSLDRSMLNMRLTDSSAFRIDDRTKGVASPTGFGNIQDRDKNFSRRILAIEEDSLPRALLSGSSPSTVSPEVGQGGETKVQMRTTSPHDRRSELFGIGCWCMEQCMFPPNSSIDFMAADLYALFNEEWDPEARGCPSGSPHFSKPAEATGSASKSSNASKSRRGGGAKKPQKRHPDDGEDGDDDEDDPKTPKRKKITSSRATDPTMKLACPFLKNDPQIYFRDNKYLTCLVTPGFPDIARLKEHLYRTHYCHQCGRCGMVFNKQPEVINHLQETIRCVEIQFPRVSANMTAEVEATLRSRTSLRGATVVEKWFKIYRLIFPDQLDVEHISPFQENLDQLSPGLFPNDDFPSFSDQLVPGLLNGALDASLRRSTILDEETVQELKSLIISDVIACNGQVFAMYRQVQRSRNDMGQASHTNATEPLALATGNQSAGPTDMNFGSSIAISIPGTGISRITAGNSPLASTSDLPFNSTPRTPRTPRFPLESPDINFGSNLKHKTSQNSQESWRDSAYGSIPSCFEIDCQGSCVQCVDMREPGISTSAKNSTSTYPSLSTASGASHTDPLQNQVSEDVLPTPSTYFMDAFIDSMDEVGSLVSPDADEL